MLGVGLAMDAFSVSMVNGLSEPAMKRGRMCLMAGIYAFFQIIMPMTGWLCVHTILQYFQTFEKLIPWIALILLLYIGIDMIRECIRGDAEEAHSGVKLAFGTLLMQGIATSIDALSVGFTIADYGILMALAASLIIGMVTFAICMIGLKIGKTVGTALAGKAGLLGGVILIAIGLEIFIKGVF